DMVMRQITNDIRQEFEPKWTRRSMWYKSYLDARFPEVPATLIELMSHQNFADMMYGLDPNFRFTVGRSIYKGMARFLAERKGREVVIQPLAVKDFYIKKQSSNTYRLSWEPTPDPLEKTAMPDKYVIMERNEGDLGFHKIAETSSTHYDVKVTDNQIHSFKIIAANAGGLSFPSEVLALCEGSNNAKPVLVVNGFTRLSGPAQVRDSKNAGFKADEEFGVPYIKDISFTGNQTEFNRNAGNRHGASGNSYATKVIAGNTFDYAATHGDAIAETGYGFVSASASAVEKGKVKLTDYSNVDLILGKQKTTVVGNGKSGINYRAFPPELQKAIKSFLDKGGNLIISGQYVVSDLFDKRSNREDREFAEKVLGLTTIAEKERQQRAEEEARAAEEERRRREALANGDEESEVEEAAPTQRNTTTAARTSYTSVRKPDGRLLTSAGKTVNYSNTLNKDMYIVENPDILVPIQPEKAKKILTFSSNNLGAGYSMKSGKGNLTVLSVPLETIYDQSFL
ncbi:MAG: fibronectin type III domain-containing protein, partial [Muribaculaceae bacterium]|nr:fibronectin type III domain-containing protein [Muribaculaceae bacterium]